MTPIPNEVVLEFLGSVTFAHDGDTDCAIAENIASNEYNSLEDPISICRGFTNMDDTEFNAHVVACKDNEYFSKHLTNK